MNSHLDPEPNLSTTVNCNIVHAHLMSLKGTETLSKAEI